MNIVDKLNMKFILLANKF